MSLTDLSREELTSLHAEQRAAYADLQGKGLKLDLTRGKPSAAQLDLSNELLELPGPGVFDASGTDVRNYGGTQGLPEIRAIFSELIKVPVGQLVAGDNASLAIMHDTLVYALLKGTVDSDQPWSKEPIKFICPTPGYDRHFALCEQFGIEMIPVDLNADGPDLAKITELVAADPQIKGIWIVPTYANPNGAVYSEAVTKELVSMPAAAPDFRMFWDNAYAVHHLTDNDHPAIDILGLAEAAGNPNRPFIFASTSKITFAGSGVSFFGSSAANVAWYQQQLSKRTIGPDKVNHLRHALFLKDADGVRALMARHRTILAPKFDAAIGILSELLGPYGVATWTEPDGGYFISLDVVDGTATEVVRLAKEAGIAMTGAGAAFPYGKDPRDRNIRIAPSFPPPDQVAAAIEGLSVCVLLAALEQQLG